MDDGADRGFSRAPELEDLLNLCRALNREGARYLLIGGFAVILQGLVRTTKDVDLLVDASAENVQALKRALRYLPDNAVAEVGERDLADYVVVRLADEIVIDLMARAGGIAFDEAVRDGLEFRELGGVQIPLASKELLIRMKDTVRPSDASDVAALKLRIEQERGSG